MPLHTVDVYGAPAYGAIGRPPAGMVFHTPEWGADPALQNAIDCAKWQATSANTSGGSYHGLLGHGGQHTDNMATCTVADHWVMVRSVPWNLAAGGLTSRRDVNIWQPDRFPWIRASLPGPAFQDPNRWLHQISIAGRAAFFVENGYSKGLLIRLAEWVKTLETAYSYDSLMMLHRHWQADRTDPGPLDLADLVLIEYERMYNAPVPVPVPVPVPIPPPPPINYQAIIAAKNAAFDVASLKITTLEQHFATDIQALRAEIAAGRNK